MKLKFGFLFAILFSIQSFSQSSLSTNYISYIYLKSNLEFLASDELEGREAASRGEKIASLFISEELEKYGVKPFGDNGSYFQEFNMIISSYDKKSIVSFHYNDDSTESFTHGNEIFYSSRTVPTTDYANKELEIIFVGYGITSEKDNYNNYKGLDVKGKVVLVINGTPKSNGEELLSNSAKIKYNKYSEKAKLAFLNGASGMILIPNKEIIDYWSYYRKWSNSKTFKLETEINDSKGNPNIPLIVLGENSAKKLMKQEGYEFNNFLSDDIKIPQSFKLKTKVNFGFNLIIENKKSRNVIGIIEGTKNELKNEYVTIGAHYDHEGIKNGKVYYGADDNGSGTVTVLEVARQISLDSKNERPVVIIFHTAEEKGLKGAKYLVNNSDFIDNSIVHINIDMIGRRSEDSIYCIGASRISKELGELVEEVNSNTSNFYLDYTFDHPDDPNRLYFRSDHVHYAERGIPIVFFYDFMRKDYHKPTDTVDKINFYKILKMTDLVYNLTLKISNLDHKLSISNNN